MVDPRQLKPRKAKLWKYYTVFTFSISPVANLQWGHRVQPYPQSFGACECGGAESGGAKVEDGSPETQGKDTDDLRPFISLPGQSRTPLCLVFNVSEEALSPQRDVPMAHGALIAPGLPGKAWDFVIDVHDVHPQPCGGSEPLAIPHFHIEMVTVRRTVEVWESSFEMWGGRRGESLLPFCRPLQVLLQSRTCYAHSSSPPLKPHSCISRPVDLIHGHHLTYAHARHLAHSSSIIPHSISAKCVLYSDEGTKVPVD